MKNDARTKNEQGLTLIEPQLPLQLISCNKQDALKQRWMLVTLPKEQKRINCWNLIEIQLLGNYSYFYVYDEISKETKKSFALKKPLKTWLFLKEVGLVRVSPNRIINLVHVNTVRRFTLVSRYIKDDIEVTESNKQMVAEMLPIWTGLQFGNWRK